MKILNSESGSGKISDWQLRRKTNLNNKIFRIALENGNEENNFQIYARICSSEQRGTDFSTKVSYKMKVETLPATEGFLRILDMPGSSQVGRQLENKILLPDGSIQSAEIQALYQSKMELRNRINSLQALHKTIANKIMQIATE